MWTSGCGRRHEPSSRTAPAPSVGGVPAAAARSVATPVDSAALFARGVAAAPAGRWASLKGLPPALSPGPLGSWDDFQVGSPAVLQEVGPSYVLFYRGCHLQGVEYGCGVGRATSKDGVAWDRAADPVFVPADPFERAHLDGITVARSYAGYVLWYSIGTAFAPDHRHATLHAARSADGLSWTPQEGAVYESTAQGIRLTPSAVWQDARFHVWVIDSRSPLDPSTGHFPEMPAEGDDVLLHFVSSEGVRLDPNGVTPTQTLGLDRGALSVDADPAGGFRALVYEQHPRGTNPQGVAVLRSSDGSRWERAAADAMPLAVWDLDAHAVPVSVVGVEAPRGVLAWFGVRGNKGGEAIRAGFFRKS